MASAANSGIRSDRASGAVNDTVILSFRNATVSYPGKRKTERTSAVVGVDLEILKGQFVCIVGPSGCGKSTILNVAAGLTKVSSGEMDYLGRSWPGLHAGVGYVTQRDTLLPWKNVVGNIAVPLMLSGVGRRERTTRATDMARSLGLAHALDRHPHQLSGGMRQRVQLGRVLVTDPNLMLMDEPFGALDAVLRVRMQEFLKEKIAEQNLTTVFVTHDLAEALTVGDKVVAMSGTPGRIGRIDTLEDMPHGVSAMELRRSAAYIRHEQELWETIAGEPDGSDSVDQYGSNHRSRALMAGETT